jgi:hypothetical protein
MIRRRSDVGVGAVCVAIGMAMYLAASGMGDTTGRLALFLLLFSSLVAAWTFFVPFVVVRKGIAVWRISPISRPKTVDLSAIQDARPSDSSLHIVITMRDLSVIRIPVGMMDQSQLGQLLDELQEVRRSADGRQP